MPNLEIIQTDSLQWLPANPNQGSIITCLPDASELGFATGQSRPSEGFKRATGEDLAKYDAWFENAARLCFAAVSPDCPIVFIQTDRKGNGRWLDKGHSLQAIADSLGFHLLWHKIELRVPAGQKYFFRPGFKHVLAFGKGNVRPGDATEDVILPGPALYADGTCYRTAELAAKLCLLHTKKILDPFCGRGTFPIVADYLGADATGLDISAEQCAQARDSQSALAALGIAPLFQNL